MGVLIDLRKYKVLCLCYAKSWGCSCYIMDGEDIFDLPYISHAKDMVS